VILCGGLGTRLREEIGENQKVMADVNGQPFLGLLLNVLKEQGLKRFVLCTGYQASQVENYVKEGLEGCEIEFSYEDSPLGTGGAVKQAAALVQSDSFFVLNGDSLCRMDYKDLLAVHLSRSALATVGLTEMQQTGDYGSVIIDDQDRVMSFCEKQASNPAQAQKKYVNAGVYCFQKEIFQRMPEDQSFSLERDVFPAITENHFYGYHIKQSFFDIGTPERYKSAQEGI